VEGLRREEFCRTRLLWVRVAADVEREGGREGGMERAVLGSIEREFSEESLSRL